MIQELKRMERQFLPTWCDFKQPQTLDAVRKMADELLAHTALARLQQLEVEASADASIANFSRLAVKLAKSRARMLALPEPTLVSVVIPMYGENARIAPRGNEAGQHPHGEDAIRQKHLQLAWLFAGTPHTYQVLCVDDMSKPEPITSGEAAQAAINAYSIPNFRVLYLKDGVDQEKHGPTLVSTVLRNVQFPKNTKKAAAVYYGFAKAITDTTAGMPHVVCTTDLDLTIDLGQMGNLIAPVAQKQCVAAAASRRLPTSVLELGSNRNLRANAARYFRLLLLPGLLPKDTQCGGKAFNAESLAVILEEGLHVLSFSFDIELLTRFAVKYGPEQILPVAVAAFDSAAMTTTDSSVHHEIMRTQHQLAQELQIGVQNPEYQEVARLSEQLTQSEEGWLTFLEKLQGRPDLVERMQALDASAATELFSLT